MIDAEDLTFRTATVADVAAVVPLVGSAYRGDASRAGWTTEADLLDGQRVDAAMVSDVVGSADAEIVLAEAGGRLLACCELRHRADGLHHLARMAQASRAVPGDLEHRVRELVGGVGRQVLAEGERRAAARGSARVVLSVLDARAELIAWYERRGYVRTGDTAAFPYGDDRFGLPTRDDLSFVLLVKPVGG